MTVEDKLKLIYSDDSEFEDVLENPIHPVKTCKACGKPFVPSGRNWTRQKTCSRKHFINCLNCGQPIRQDPVDLSAPRLSCCPECNKIVKARQTKLAIKEKYGVENILELPEYRAKAIAGIRAKAPETTKKVVATMNERYGGMGEQSPILKAKIQATMKERYGNINPAKNDDIRKKISEATRSLEYLAKYEATAIANWGVRRPSMTQEVQDKMKATSLERYGVECTLQTDYAKQRLEEVCLDKYGVPHAFQSDYCKEKSRQSFIEHMHNHNNKISKINQAVAEMLLTEFGVNTEFEWSVSLKSYDLKVKDSNILVEINPSYTHSDLPNHWTEAGLPPDYHLNRTLFAEAHGYRCIHIFEWDDFNKVGQLLHKKLILYARKCKLVKLSSKQAADFLDKFHLQGSVTRQMYCYGLTYNGELVEIMTFGKPRYNRNFEWELLRLCTDYHYKVVGGASKLFNAFISEVNPASILSYCDRAKFTGVVYARLGMQLDHTSPPAKVWSKGSKHVTDNLLRQRGYDQLFGTNYGKGTSNEDLMIENGWRSVYDCGQLVFSWHKERASEG